MVAFRNTVPATRGDQLVGGGQGHRLRPGSKGYVAINAGDGDCTRRSRPRCPPVPTATWPRLHQTSATATQSRSATTARPRPRFRQRAFWHCTRAPSREFSSCAGPLSSRRTRSTDERSAPGPAASASVRERTRARGTRQYGLTRAASPAPAPAAPSGSRARVARSMPISHIRFADRCASKSRAVTSAASRAVAEAVSSLCSMPRSPAKAQQPASSGTTTSSAHASATAAAVPRRPGAASSRWGGARPSRPCAGPSRCGSSSSAAHDERVDDRQLARAARGCRRSGTAPPRAAMPSVQEEASTTSGSRPPAVQPQAASTIRLAITALPASYPLECQIVAQQVPATSSGIHTGLPGPGRDGHHGLRQGGPVPAVGTAEDPVDAGRVVDGGRARPVGGGQPPRRGAGDLRQPLGHEVGAYGLAGGPRHGLQQPVAAPRRRAILSAAATASRAEASTAREVPRGQRRVALLARASAAGGGSPSSGRRCRCRPGRRACRWSRPRRCRRRRSRRRRAGRRRRGSRAAGASSPGAARSAGAEWSSGPRWGRSVRRSRTRCRGRRPPPPAGWSSGRADAPSGRGRGGSAGRAPRRGR